MKDRKDKETWIPRSRPQTQLAPLSVTFRALVDNPEIYAVPPSFQRNEVWGITDKQAFIDSIFLSMIHIELDAFQEFIQGQRFLRLINGFQRISTIIEFYNDGFKTWTVAQKEHAEPNSDPPAVQPGVFFSQLPIEEQNYYLDFTFFIHLMPKGTPMSQILTYFLRIQNQVPLTAAERLGIYVSKAALAANKIAEHTFWGDLYGGDAKRKQKYQSSLHLLALEIGPMDAVDLASWKFLHKLAAGSYDDKITDATVESVITRLDDICFLYAGTRFTRRVIAIVMYQSALLLEEAGYTIRTKDKGKLTPWLTKIIDESSHTTLIPNYSCPIQQILRPETRKAFWNIHLKIILATFNINQPFAKV